MFSKINNIAPVSLAAALLFSGCGKGEREDGQGQPGAEAPANVLDRDVSKIVGLVRELTARHQGIEKARVAASKEEANTSLAQFFKSSAEILHVEANGTVKELEVRLNRALIPKGYLVLCDTAVRSRDGLAYLQVAICPVKESETVKAKEFTFPGLRVGNPDFSVRVIEFLPPVAGRLSPPILDDIGDVAGRVVGTDIMLNSQALDREALESGAVSRLEAKRWTVANEFSSILLGREGLPVMTIRKKGGDTVQLKSGELLTSIMVEEAYSDWCSLENTRGAVCLTLVRNALFGGMQNNYAFSQEISRDSFDAFILKNNITVPWVGSMPPNQDLFEHFVAKLTNHQHELLRGELLAGFSRRVGEFGPLLVKK